MTYNSRNLTFEAGENVTQNNPCYLNDDGEAQKVDLTDAIQKRFVGIAATTVSEGDYVALQGGIQTATSDEAISPGAKVRFSCTSGTAGRVIAMRTGNDADLMVGVALESFSKGGETGNVFFY
jgi:hypothetical protein